MAKDKFSLLLIIFFALTSKATGQNIEVNEDPQISQLMNQISEKFDYDKKTKGWRIQILHTPSRRVLEDVRASFGSRFPWYSTKWSYQKPYYNLKVGAFQNKLNAYPLYKRIKRYYPSSFLVLDDMSIEEIFRFERVNE